MLRHRFGPGYLKQPKVALKCHLRTEGIDESTVQAFLGELQQTESKWSPPGTIDWSASRQLPSWPTFSRIELVLKELPSWQHALAIKERLHAFIQATGICIKQKPVVLKLEPRPDLIPLNRAAARAMRWMSSRGLATERGSNQLFKPVWAPERLLIRHVPSSDNIAANFSQTIGPSYTPSLL